MSSCSVRWVFRVTPGWHPSVRQLQRLLGSVQQEEVARLLELQYRRDLLTSLSGRVLVRRLLTTNGGRFTCTPDGLSTLHWSEICLARTARGKPYLQRLATSQEEEEGTAQWLFNVSHDDGVVMLAAEATRKSSSSDPESSPGVRVLDVGCDVVGMRRHPANLSSVNRLFTLMRRQFTQHEWQYIEGNTLATLAPSISEERQKLILKRCLQRFYRCWALKESYVKADGCGVTMDLQRINFTCSTVKLNKTDCHVTDMQAGDWSNQSRDSSTSPLSDNGKCHVTLNSADDWCLESGDHTLLCTDTCVSLDGRIDTTFRFEEHLLDFEHILCVAVRYSLPLSASFHPSVCDKLRVLSVTELMDSCMEISECDESVCRNVLRRPYSPQHEL